MEPEHEQNSHVAMTHLLRENNRLLEENNAMLRKQERRAKWALMGKILWFAVLIGLPLIMYWYLRDSVESLLSLMQAGQGAGGGIDMEALEQLLETYNIR